MTNSGKTRPNWNISWNCVWYDSNKFAKLLGMTSQSRASSPWFSGRFSSCLVTKLWWGNFCSNKYIKISNTLKHFSNVFAELENVKSFTRTNINKPDFTPRKARKSRHFWHFKPTKQNLWGFLWWINVDKLSIYGSLSIDLKFVAHIFPKMACFC